MGGVETATDRPDIPIETPAGLQETVDMSTDDIKAAERQILSIVQKIETDGEVTVQAISLVSEPAGAAVVTKAISLTIEVRG